MAASELVQMADTGRVTITGHEADVVPSNALAIITKKGFWVRHEARNGTITNAWHRDLDKAVLLLYSRVMRKGLV